MGKNAVFFICGPQRSGTTLLADLLSKHPDMYLPKDALGFRLVNSFTNYREVLPFNVEHSWARIQSWIIDNDYKGRAKSVIPLDSIPKHNNARELLSESIEALLQRKKKSILGDKTPNMEFHLASTLSLLPEAKFIHVVRDGRSVAASMKKRAKKSLRLAAHHWVEATTMGLYHETILGKEQYLLIKYEDLLQRPEEVLKKLCSFLSLDYVAEMLVPSENSLTEDSYVNSFLDTSKTQDFTNTLSRKQIRTVEKIQGSVLHKFGYDLMVEQELRRYRKISFWSFARCHLSEALQQFFNAEHEGMRGRKKIKVKISFYVRLKNLFFKLCLIFLPNFFWEKVKIRRMVGQLIYSPENKNEGAQ